MLFLPLFIGDYLSQSMGCISVRLNPDLTIHQLNDEAEKLYGSSLEAAAGKHFIQLCNSLGVAPPIDDFSAIFSGEIIKKHKQLLSIKGFIRKIEWSIFPIFEVVDKPKVTAIFLIGLEENFHSKQQIREKILTFENILNHVPSAIFWKDKNSVFLGCNKKFAQMADLKSPSKIVGKTDYDLPWTHEESAAYIADDRSVIQNKEQKINIEEQLTQNGHQLFLSTSKVPLYDEKGEVSGVLGIFSDITERKKNEEALSLAVQKLEVANKTKTEFLENMRHDIRTPLTGIIGFAEIIKNESTDIKIKKYADNLVMSSHSLLELLNSVLEAMNVSSGEIPLLKKKFNLKNKLNEIVLLNQPKAHQKKIALSFENDPAIPDYLIGDSKRIHRVVLELVTNALNFTHEGHVKISTKLEKKYKNSVIIKIIVADTGIGIKPEQQQDIYVQFKRLTPSYEGIYKGTGLGLAIARQFVDDLQGELYVESEVNVGSTFTCIFKLKRPLLDDEFGSGNLPPLNNTHKFSPVTDIEFSENILQREEEEFESHVLVVEDGVIAATVIVSMLSAMGCKVDVANKGQLAVQMASTNKYDLIFMDIGLPDMDGYETTKKIRSNELDSTHVPIVALTAHVNESSKKNCISIGMNAVLSKPLKIEHAEEVLNVFIAYRRKKLNASASQNAKKDIEEPVLAFELIEKRYGDKTAIDMLHMLLESFPEELDDFQAAYEKKDWLSIRGLAHRLKGGVSYCGTIRLGEACAQLESSIRQEKSELYEKCYSQLLDEIAAAEKVITEKLQM